MLHIASLKCEDKVYLMASDDGPIQGWASEEDALADFESTYHEAITLGGWSRTSACLFFVLYDPHIHPAPRDLDNLKSLGLTNPEDDDLILFSIESSYAQGITGFLLTGDQAKIKQWRETGAVPNFAVV